MKEILYRPPGIFYFVEAYQNPHLINHMKLKLPLLVGLASLAALVGVQAQSAVTDPVGYITVTLNPSTSGYSAISPTLVNKTEFAGVAATVSATTIGLTGVPLTAGAFASGYWLEVTNGAGEGAWTNITGNTTSSVTVAESMIAFMTAGTSTIKIRKHVTVSDFFGATNSAGLLPGGDAGTADEVFFIEPGGNPALTTEVFFDGAAWTDLNFDPAATKAIEPGQGLLVQRKTATPKSFVYTGYVKTGKSMTQIATGPNVVSIPSAVGYTLATSGLVGATNSNGVGLTSGGDAGTADEAFLFDVSPTGISHFFDGAAWNNIDFDPAGTKVLKEGSAAYIIHKTPGAYNWVAPAVVIAN
jgi:uncharacterized protein (TIGR02597 family)